MDDTHPSANPAPRRLDLDLSFPTLGLGHLLESQVFFAVEPHGAHHFSRGRSHDVGPVPVGMKIASGPVRVASNTRAQQV
jgi:hypothetical protein